MTKPETALAGAYLQKPVDLFIGGASRRASDGRYRTIENPATGEIVGEVAVASADDLDLALASAQAGFLTWRDMAAYDRARIMRSGAAAIRRDADLIAAAISLEQGKPVAEARIEAANCADVLEWYADEGRRAYGRIIPSRQPGVLNMATREPIGPVAAFSPWNFPASQGVRKIAAALGAGCSIVIKGPEEAPSALAHIAGILHEAGLPDGVLNVVFGEPAAISRHLIASPIIRKVSFTGSVAVGKLIAQLAAAAMKPCTMELGGHAPVLVFEDAPVAAVAAALARMKALNAGQVCVSPTRFIVQETIAEAFEQHMVEDMAKAVVGPLAHAGRLKAAEDLVADAKATGGRVAAGGARVGNRGYFFAPTLLADVPDEARIWREEPFAPIATLSRFDSFSDAVTKANASTMGLAAYAFTDSQARIARLMREIDTGMLGINHFGVGQIETPFGGVKDSGYGREGGYEGLDAYLSTRFISQLTGAPA